ncbi:hypothetical protein [Gluconobacter sp. P1C6_b]|uniref:hypothetical protein n=1 Tax=Gluconobacter sp. P1C6_b TaxID=2762619 RepID=UPI00207B18B5|nr:hypothetical protein [Gluconobacter sp. P1C6_b]
MDIVLGASGHVGGTVARRLLEQGRAVTVVLHRPDRLLNGRPAGPAWPCLMSMTRLL